MSFGHDGRNVRRGETTSSKHNHGPRMRPVFLDGAAAPPRRRATRRRQPERSAQRILAIATSG
ncbi:hypothetical protein LC55x_2749 [Lysobacter capsici]|nr:hypothetical protein LC55x_2749 [Lysobacter capsici]